MPEIFAGNDKWWQFGISFTILSERLYQSKLKNYSFAYLSFYIQFSFPILLAPII